MPKNSVTVRSRSDKATFKWCGDHGEIGVHALLFDAGFVLTRAQARKFFERGLALLNREPKQPKPRSKRKETLIEYCGDCDGCGWVEGGRYIKNTCKTCKGSGRAGTGRGEKRG